MFNNIKEVLPGQLFGINTQEYLLATVVFISAVVILRIFKFFILKKLKKLSTKTKTEFDDLIVSIIENVKWPFYVIISLFFSLKLLPLPELVDKTLYYLILVFLIYYVIRGLQNIIDFGTKKVVKKQENKKEDPTTVFVLSKILKISLWAVALLLLLSNLGYNITSLLAGLGIGGIAVALALQNILTDIFASFSIYFDKPFKVGDFIIVGENLGVVKKIGIKTTRLQSLWGEEVVISNKELTSTRINNYGKIQRRRIHFNFGLVYQTSNKKLKRALEIVKEVFEKIDLADLDRVHFKEFGNSSLNFEVAYYVNTGDYNKYMDVRQQINLEIKEAFEKEKIEFAYPTQTIFVEKPKL